MPRRGMVGQVLKSAEDLYHEGPWVISAYMMCFLLGMLFGVFGTVWCFMGNERVAKRYLERIKYLIREEKEKEKALEAKKNK